MTEDLNRTITDAIPVAPTPTRGPLRPSLVEIAGGEFGRQFFLEGSACYIGRSDDVEIQIADARASRRHAVIEIGVDEDTQNIRCVARDLDSRNGTFVNGQRITSAPLHEGDKIQIGYTIFKFALKDTVEMEFESKIYKLATTDPLTGLFTRDYFGKEFTRTLHHCIRYERPLAVLMIDLDDFKAVNDTHGHQTGDKVLQAFASLLRETLRDEDVLGRYGGEEFIVVMPETEAAAARFPAERFLKLLERREVENQDGTPVCVTASIGISGLGMDGTDEHALVAAADKALYAAKAAGKNRVVLSEGATQAVAPPGDSGAVELPEDDDPFAD